MPTLSLVGIGPGAEDLVTPRARRALEQAAVIVGYTRYVDLVRAWLPGACFLAYPIGSESERVREALSLAARHEHVALLGSGDAGVYGLAGLAFELRAAMAWGEGGAPEVEVIPGVTAATAAAALLGAPLGHDFAAISLSDLLTPWEVIARRVEAAAAADFVIALYNPASRARRRQLDEARAILLRHRTPETPVGIVTDAARAGERVLLTTLAAMPVEEVGMLSIVIVGNSQTFVDDGRMVTPRGYGAMEGRVESAGSGTWPGGCPL
jgi:precorrin-3B C17-methyltransferase